jgi:ADP-heptose:LPS heptosyltransferase
MAASTPTLAVPNPVRMIAIPMMAGIGNCLMAVPMVRQLARAFPSARVVVLARLKVTGEIFHRLGEVAEVRITGTKASSLWSHTRRLASEGCDLYVVPFPSNRWQYTLLAGLSGARIKLMHGYEVGRLRALHDYPGITRVPARRGIHDVTQNLALLEPLGLATDPAEKPVFLVGSIDRERSAAMLRQAGVPEGVRPIVIHAGCRQTVLAAAKRWPAEKYGQLIQALEQRFGRRIVLVEGPEEAGVADEIRPHCGNASPFVLHLRGPLGDTAALLEGAMLYVGTDSGLAHLAASVGTTPVTLFAPADPDRCSPFGYRHLVIQPRGKTCPPCFKYPLDACKPKVDCREPMCIREIALEDVLAKVDEATRGTAILDAPRPVRLNVV